MTDINKLLNTTAAGLLAQKLDAKDGNKDEKISGSIWNQFVEANGVGKKISEHGSISIVNAMKSITTYVVREVHAKNKTEAEVVASFNEKADQLETSAPAASADPADKTAKTGGTKPADPTDPATKTKPKEPVKPADPADNKAQVQADYESVKVTVPKRYASKEVRDIYKYKEEGEKVAANLDKGKTDGITPENAAYAINHNNVNFGPGRRKAAQAVFENLVSRMKKLNILKPYDLVNWDSFSKLSYQKQNDKLINYRSRIIAVDNKIIKEDNAERNNFNNNIRPKAQKTFDDATKFMAEVANMNPKPEIKRDGDFAKAKLPDGRYITVSYDNEGKIREIFINDDVYFDKDFATFNYDKSNNKDEGIITSGYDFEKLKALAEKIFGQKE